MTNCTGRISIKCTAHGGVTHSQLASLHKLLVYVTAPTTVPLRRHCASAGLAKSTAASAEPSNRSLRGPRRRKKLLGAPPRSHRAAWACPAAVPRSRSPTARRSWANRCSSALPLLPSVDLFGETWNLSGDISVCFKSAARGVCHLLFLSTS